MANKIIAALLQLKEAGLSTPELDAQLAEMQAAENTDEDTKEETETELEAKETPEKAAVPDEPEEPDESAEPEAEKEPEGEPDESEDEPEKPTEPAKTEPEAEGGPKEPEDYEDPEDPEDATYAREVYPGQISLWNEDPGTVPPEAYTDPCKRPVDVLEAEVFVLDTSGKSKITDALYGAYGAMPPKWRKIWVQRYKNRAEELGMLADFEKAWNPMSATWEAEFREWKIREKAETLTREDFEKYSKGSIYDEIAWLENQHLDRAGAMEDACRSRAYDLGIDNIFEYSLDNARKDYGEISGSYHNVPAWRLPADTYAQEGLDTEGVYVYLARLEACPATSGYAITEGEHRKQAAAYGMSEHFEAALATAKEAVAVEVEEAKEMAANCGVKPLGKVTAEDFKGRAIYVAIASLDPLDREDFVEKYREKFEEFAKAGEINPKKFDKMMKAADTERKQKEAAAKKAEREAAARSKEARAQAKAKARDARAQETEEEHTTAYSNLPEDCTGNKPIPHLYTVDDAGIYIDTQDVKGNPVTKLISRTPMLINRMVSGDNYVEFLHMQDGHWRTDTEEYGTLTVASEVKNLIKRYKVSVSDKNYGLLADYFQAMYDVGTTKGIWQYIPMLKGCGWYDEFTKFCVCPDANKEDAVIRNAADYEDLQAAMGPHGDREKYYKVHKELRAQKIKMFHVALITNFASVLFSILKSQGVTLNIYGTSSRGKSQAAFFAATVWGSSDYPGAFIQGIGDTKRNMQETLGYLNNICATYDDANNVSRSDPGLLQDIAYMIANGNTRGGCTKEGRRRKKAIFCTSGVITSEQRITFQGDFNSTGGYNRVYGCEVPDVCPWSDNRIRKLRNFFSSNFGFAGPEFAAKVAELRTTIAEEKDEDGEEQNVINALYEKYQKELHEAAATIGKKVSSHQVMRTAILMVADHIAEEYIYHDNIRMSAAQWAEGMDDEAEIDQDERFVQAIRDDLAENAAHYWGASYAGNAFLEPLYGISNDDILYITPKHLVDLAHEHNEDPKLFFPWAYKHGYMVDPGLDGKNKPINPKKQLRCRARKNPLWVYELHNICADKKEEPRTQTPEPEPPQEGEIAGVDIDAIFGSEEQSERKAPQRQEARQISIDEYKRQQVEANFQRERATMARSVVGVGARTGIKYMDTSEDPFGDIDDDYAFHAHPANEQRKA